MTGSARIAGILEALDDETLMVVTNREPYVHEFSENGSIEVHRPAGGLVTSVDPVMQACRGTWIAWGSGSADFAVADGSGRLPVPPSNPAYALRRVRLSKEVVAEAYYGYSNQGLWPLCHSAFERPSFTRTMWEGYLACNAAFAEAAIDEAVRSPSPLIWLHDYHLAIAPAMIRQALPQARLAHFWHIPWPSWDVFRTCPQRREILTGLLANDLVGFHLPWHRDNFLTCCRRELDAEVDGTAGIVSLGRRRTQVIACPISIDFRGCRRLAAAPEVARMARELRSELGLEGKIVALGVDRLDYTKGIPQRLDAFELFLRRHPDHREKVTLVQKVERSRVGIKAYRRLERLVERKVRAINRRYGSDSWTPVIYLQDRLDRKHIMALYSLADVMMVTSLADGMNLVAKEFVACKPESPGVLILSELAGASEELVGAIRVNPYDAEGVAEAIYTAVSMPPGEALARIRAMESVVEENDVFGWMQRFLSRVPKGTKKRAPGAVLSAELPDLRRSLDAVERRLKESSALALCLDFDGTLAPIAPTPSEARMPRDTRLLLARVSSAPGVACAIISGRSIADLKPLVGIPGLVYAGDHGLEIEAPRWTYSNYPAKAARAVLEKVCDGLEMALRDFPGVIVERKTFTATVHYRLVPARLVPDVSRRVESVVNRANAGIGGELSAAPMFISHGKKCLEIRPKVKWDKGEALKMVLQRELDEHSLDEAFIVYLGDDRADESAFAAVASYGLAVRVGKTDGVRSRATQSLPSPDAVRDFLAWLAKRLGHLGVYAAQGSRPAPSRAVP